MGLDVAVRNFIYLVVDHRRTEILPEMEEAFLSELNERLGIVEAEVTSAHELSDDEKRQLRTVLEQRTGKKVEARFQIRAPCWAARSCGWARRFTTVRCGIS